MQGQGVPQGCVRGCLLIDLHKNSYLPVGGAGRPDVRAGALTPLGGVVQEMDIRVRAGLQS